MSLLEHVAMAIDFSEPSKVALRACFRLARLAPVNKITLMHSVQAVVLPAGDQPVVKQELEGLRERIHGAAMENMQKFCAAVDAPDDVEVVLRVVEGAPARAIPDAALAEGATLLVLGTHGRKGLKRWLKGSVAEAIVRGAALPILVMLSGDDGVDPEHELERLGHVLCAVDVHAEAFYVVEAALEAALSVKPPAEVTLLTVGDVMVDVPYGGDDPQAMKAVETVRAALSTGAEAQLEQLASAFSDRGVVIHRRVTEGDPDDVIPEIADEIGASMIVLGSHGRNMAPLIDMGSTTAHILRTANVAVLVVPSHPAHRS